MKICALIAAYNEAPAVGGVVAAARNYVDEVIVVDDGSRDGTAAIAAAAGATCLRIDENQGKGAALRLALAQILPRDFTHVLFMDGDGQHRSEDIPALLDQARATSADLVIGARSFDRASMPRSRYLSNTLGSAVASRMVRRRIADTQSGFRLVRVERLRPLRLRSRKYEFEMELLIKLCSAGASVVDAPVTLVYDERQARSKMRPVHDTVRTCLWSIGFRYLGL